MSTVGRMVAGTAAVVVLLLLWALAQGMGEAVGQGLSEWLVR